MKIDRYTKIVLTTIAVGVIGLNIHFFRDDFVKEANAYVEDHDHGSWEWWASDLVNSNINEYEIEDIIEDCEVYVYGSYGEISC